MGDSYSSMTDFVKGFIGGKALPPGSSESNEED